MPTPSPPVGGSEEVQAEGSVSWNTKTAGGVKLEFVNGREGKIAKAVLTAISNTRRGSGDSREEESTAIQWTLWGNHVLAELGALSTMACTVSASAASKLGMVAMASRPASS